MSCSSCKAPHGRYEKDDTAALRAKHEEYGVNATTLRPALEEYHKEVSSSDMGLWADYAGMTLIDCYKLTNGMADPRTKCVDIDEKAAGYLRYEKAKFRLPNTVQG